MKFASLVWWTTTAVLLGLGSSVANGLEETTTTVEATLESASPGSSAHGLGSSVANGLEATVTAEATFESASSGPSAHGHVRKSSIVNGGHHGHGRNLLFLKKKSVTIDSPLNGAVIAASNDGSKMDVVVSFKSGGLFNKLKTIDLLMDSKVVATKQSASVNGKESFSVDLKGVASGLHQLQARGSAGARLFPNLRRGRSVQSKVVSVTINTTSPVAPSAPTVPTVAAPKVPAATDPSAPMAPKVPPVKPPTKAPTRPIVVSPINATACDLDQSFLYFTGPSEAISTDKGVVNVTWMPAFVFGLQDVNFLWCGNLSYDVFVVQGETNFTDLNATVPELVERSKRPSSGMKHIETTALSLAVRDLAPGLNYSILVTAKTASGHFSYNREQAVVTVATTSPVIKSNFTRMVVIPESNGTFQVKKVDGQNAVVFSGNLPDEALSVKPLDFVYFFDSDGNANMGQFLTMTNGAAGQVTWAYRPADLSDVFDELDISGDVANQGLLALQFDNDGNAENALSNAEYDSLDMNVKVNLCIAYGVDAATCLEELNGRRLIFGFIGKALKDAIKAVAGFFKRAAETVAIVIGSIAESIGGIREVIRGLTRGWKKFLTAGVTRPIRLLISTYAEDRLQLARLDSAAKLTHSTGAELGVHFDMDTRCKFKIKLVLPGGNTGSLQFYGTFGLEGYLSATSRSEANLRVPNPVKTQELAFRYQRVVRGIPIVVSSRQAVHSFAELAMATEGKALLVSPLARYVYRFNFLYDSKAPNPYTKSTLVIPAPIFSAMESVTQHRFNASTEFGATLAWDAFLHNLFQANVAVDVGIKADVEVGASVESISRSPPTYTLDRFDMESFVRVRSLMDRFTNRNNITRAFASVGANTSMQRVQSHTIPIPTWNTSAFSLSPALQKGLDKARVDPKLKDATTIFMAQLQGLEPDPYKGVKAPLIGIDRSFASIWLSDSDDVTLTRLPSISLAGGELPQICTGSDAISFSVLASSSDRDAIQSSLWFPNFDGAILKEDTRWVIRSNRSDFNKVTMSLPRSAINQSGFVQYELPGSLSSVYLRASPKFAPFTNAHMFETGFLEGVVKVPQFECCVAADCSVLGNTDLQGKADCGPNRMCILGDRLAASPNVFFFDQSTAVTFTVNLKGLRFSPIQYYEVYKVNEVTGTATGLPLFTLEDKGTGKGDDKNAGDGIFSNAVPLTIQPIPKSGFQAFRAVPVIGSISTAFLDSPFVMNTVVRHNNLITPGNK